MYRVAGALLALYTYTEEEADRIDLDLIVPATHPVTAEYAAKLIVAPDYNYARWVGKPTIEEVESQ